MSSAPSVDAQCEMVGLHNSMLVFSALVPHHSTCCCDRYVIFINEYDATLWKAKLGTPCLRVEVVTVTRESMRHEPFPPAPGFRGGNIPVVAKRGCRTLGMEDQDLYLLLQLCYALLSPTGPSCPCKSRGWNSRQTGELLVSSFFLRHLTLGLDQAQTTSPTLDTVVPSL